MLKKDNPTPNLILLGAGGHCKACIDVIEAEGKYTIAGILDMADRVGQNILGYPVIGTDDEIPTLVQKGFCFFISIEQTISLSKSVDKKL